MSNVAPSPFGYMTVALIISSISPFELDSGPERLYIETSTIGRSTNELDAATYILTGGVDRRLDLCRRHELEQEPKDVPALRTDVISGLVVSPCKAEELQSSAVQ